MDLYLEWLNLCQRIGAKGSIDEIFNELTWRYREKHRHYHDFSHIAHCLSELKQAWRLARDPDKVAMALWFHDVIYETNRDDNEEKSADLAKDACRKMQLPDSFGERVSELVLSSKYHRGRPDDPDEQLFTDIDLSSWGKPHEEFKRDTTKIRAEYSWVPEDVFRSKRAEILYEFLKRPRIYSTDLFLQKYETRARENLKRSIAELKTGV